MNTYIVGLNIANHDSAACLLKNGEIVSYAEQERFSRNKIALGEAPIDALKYCLENEGIGLQDVEAIGIGMDWSYRKEKYQEPEKESSKYFKFNDPEWFLPKSIFGKCRPQIYPIRHHLAHAASAYRLSGFKNSAILVIDNRGEDASSSLGFTRNGKIELFKQINIQNSLGIFYNSACKFTGLYGKYREVGKFMGLASYGIPNMEMPLSPSKTGKIYTAFPCIDDVSIYDSIQIRSKSLGKYFKENCFPFEVGNVEEIMSYANFAASVQKTLETIILSFVSELKEETKFDSLVLAGGVALNCSANGKIEKSGLFRNLYIPPFASDAGTAVGAAMEINYRLHGKPHTLYPVHYADYGVAYSDRQIEIALEKYGEKICFIRFDDKDLFEYVAKHIADGKIVAWMQGRFEAGPRALGNRSILADPRTRKSLIRLNIIKQREMWRPIAPSILEEYYSEYFNGTSDNKFFMNIATTVKKGRQNKVPAIVHVDETARPHVVTPKNERYYKLIAAFYNETGIPLLCNTSFNQKGIPLVNTPENAIDCFLQTEIDLLVMGNFVVKKQRGF